MRVLAKKQYIKDLKANDIVEDVFSIQSKEQIRKYKDKQGVWFSLKISDSTGSLTLKYWGSDEQQTNILYSSVNEQDVVFVKGQVKEFRSELSIDVDPATGELRKMETYDKSDFVAKTSKNIDEMKSQLLSIISNIKNNDIKRLLKSFFDDEKLMSNFCECPAASTRHHNYIGGLLEHVLSLISITKKIVEIHSELDEDLLIAGCILHDVGKMKELEVKATIGYSTEGKLLGHINIGQKMVSDKIDTLDGFSPILRDKIIHLILSHHGKQEWGSPVEPKFPEAVALHYIDQCDAKIKDVIQKKKNAGEGEWTYTRDFGDIYLE